MDERILTLGLVGQIGAGKGTIAKYLKDERSFYTISLSDFVREEAKRCGFGNPTREDLQNVGDDLRSKFGSNILAVKALENIKSAKANQGVIDGIRHPAEIYFLREQANFYLVAVTAPQEVRFQRLQERHRFNNSQAWEEWLEVDNRDWGGANDTDHQQSIQVCLGLADFKVDNSSSVDNLYKQIEQLLNTIQKTKR